MSDTTDISTPDPAVQTLVFTALRAVLQILGVVGVTVPALTNASALWAVAGGIAVLGSLVWSVWQKYAAARAAHVGAVASAASGMAVSGEPK